MTSNQRGLDPRIQNAWLTAIEKENKLRLKWFTNNMERLNRIANKEPTKRVPQEVKDKLKNDLIESYQNVERFPRIKTEDAPSIEPKPITGKGSIGLVIAISRKKKKKVTFQWYDKVLHFTVFWNKIYFSKLTRPRYDIFISTVQI